MAKRLLKLMKSKRPRSANRTTAKRLGRNGFHVVTRLEADYIIVDAKQTFEYAIVAAEIRGMKRMMARRHHSPGDVVAKLRQADEMAAQGSTQKEIARALGISIMTYHRWRKSREDRPTEPTPPMPDAGTAVPMASARLSNLQLENERLRRLVTDLLLEKLALQEELEGRARTARRRES